MSLNKFLQSPKGRLSVSLIHSFNVAAICALGIWNGYLLRLQHAAPAPLELTLAGVTAGAPCCRLPLAPDRNPNSKH